MATLASVKSHLTILGIIPLSDEFMPSALQPFTSVINVVYPSFWLFSLVTYSLASFYFVCFEAATFVEYAESVFYCSVTFLHVTSYVILLLNRSNLFALLNNSDAIIQKSELLFI